MVTTLRTVSPGEIHWRSRTCGGPPLTPGRSVLHTYGMYKVTVVDPGSRPVGGVIVGCPYTFMSCDPSYDVEKKPSGS